MSVNLHSYASVDEPEITYRDDGPFAAKPAVIIGIGNRGSLHVPASYARKLAEDILAVLPAAVTA